MLEIIAGIGLTIWVLLEIYFSHKYTIGFTHFVLIIFIVMSISFLINTKDKL